MSQMSDPLDEQIAAVRRFNRFYTRQLGLLNEGLLKSKYSLTEVRVMYELAHQTGLTASDLARQLGLDAGYLSRLLKKFLSSGLLRRSASASDGRQTVLALTAAGDAAFRPLNQLSRDEVAAMLSGLSDSQGKSLVESMQTIRHLLGDDMQAVFPCLIRSLQPGDIGWIVHRQGVLYYREYGWDETFEALVAEILAGFVKSFDPAWERAWIVEREAEVVGSVFIVRESDAQAKLRLLYVDPKARGLGLGRRLVGECIDFARSKGYSTLTLWTNDILVSARRIYQAAGFQLVGEEAHHSFGKDLVGQNWSLDL